MLIEEFINTTENWEEVLAAAPYYVKTTWDGDYFILKYNQLNSDFSNEIVCQCRGSIFFWNGNKAECVCRPFDKFFNVQEENAATIDWSSACVEEKVDGSLMKLWYHNGAWHLSTNGTINAFKAPINDLDVTFGDIFIRALGMPLKEFVLTLNKDYTHLFELVSPETRIIVFYEEDRVYYLTSINVKSKEEYQFPILGVNYPTEYELASLEECLAICEKMTRNEEGFVVKDKYNHRIKIKSKGWLEAHYMANNGVITRKRIVQMMKDSAIDDFLVVMPEYKGMVNNTLEKITLLEQHLETVFLGCSLFERKEVYRWLNNYPIARDYCYRHLNNKDLTAINYIFSKNAKQICNMLEGINGR